MPESHDTYDGGLTVETSPITLKLLFTEPNKLINQGRKGSFFMPEQAERNYT